MTSTAPTAAMRPSRIKTLCAGSTRSSSGRTTLTSTNATSPPAGSVIVMVELTSPVAVCTAPLGHVTSIESMLSLFPSPNNSRGSPPEL